MARRKKIYEGKAKILYEGPEPGTIVQYFKDDATAFNAAKKDVIDGKVQASPYEGELSDEEFTDRLFFGSPETVVEKFKRAASVGATHVSSWMMFGGIEHEKLMRSIRLIVRRPQPPGAWPRPPPPQDRRGP